MAGTSSLTQLRVLELYSGIGGMHWALKESGIPYEIVMAVDINSRANQIYQHNFPHVILQSFGIEKLTLKKLAALNCNAILMSPPCQPFTRSGKKGDCDDVRIKSFIHLLQLIKSLTVKPQYILVENVKGFETSRTRELLMQMLQDCHYSYQEFLLNPLQFGIPNSRLRYYLTARLIPWPCSQTFKPEEQILEVLPVLQSHSTDQNNAAKTITIDKECDQFGRSACSDIMLSPDKARNSDNQSDRAQSFIQQNSPHHQLALNISLSCDSLQNSSVPSYSIPTEEGFPSDMYNSTSSSCAVNHLYVNNELKSQRESKSFRGNTYENKDILQEQHEVSSNTYQTEDISHSVASSPEDIMALVSAGRNMRFRDECDSYMRNECRQLSEFLEKGDEENFSEYLLSDKNLHLFVIMDVVLPVLRKSMCFTKRYGHCIDGAGSVIQMSSNVEDTKTASALKSLAVRSNNKSHWGEEELSTVRKLRLRYFTPREVANLMSFPPDFTFPEGFSTVQKYRVLGNSLNVHVVSEVIKFMVT